MKRRSQRVVVARLSVAGCCALALACGQVKDPAQAQAHRGGGGDADQGVAGGPSLSGAATALAGNGPGFAGMGGATSSVGASGSDGGTLVVSAAGGASAGAGGSVDPSRTVSLWEFGGDGDDVARKVGLDANENVYVAGTTGSALNGPLNGVFDLFVRKFDASGKVLWTKQWGKAGYNHFRGLAVEASGNFYVAGESVSAVGSEPTSYYLAKYDASGALLRTQELEERTHALALDASNHLYLAEYAIPESSSSLTAVLSLRKFDPSGALEWATPFGHSATESAVDIAQDAAGNSYVASNTLEGTGPFEGFVSKFDASGGLIWSRNFANASSEYVSGVAGDPSGNVFAAGFTNGALSGTGAGANDAFIRKYDAAGNVLWTEQFGTNLTETVNAVRVDALGNPYVAGNTEGALAGPLLASRVGFVRKYDANAAVGWTEQCGATSVSALVSLAIAASGNVYGAGIVGSNALVLKIAAH